MDNVTKSGRERRKYVRVASQYIIKCEKFVLPSCEWVNNVSTMTKNISAGGILFDTAHQFAIGEIVRLELFLPGWSEYMTNLRHPAAADVTDKHSIIATVVRMEMLDQNQYEVGVCFMEMDKNDRWALMSYIYEHAPES